MLAMAEPSMKSTAWMTDDTAWMKPANEKLWEHDAPKAVGAAMSVGQTLQSLP